MEKKPSGNQPGFRNQPRSLAPSGLFATQESLMRDPGEVMHLLADGKPIRLPLRKLKRRGLSRFCVVFGAKWDCPPLCSRFEIVSKPASPRRSRDPWALAKRGWPQALAVVDDLIGREPAAAQTTCFARGSRRCYDLAKMPGRPASRVGT